MVAMARRALAGLFSFLFVVCSALGDDSLTGIWASETTFPNGLQGQLTVTRTASEWRATLSGASVRFQSTGEIRFAFSDGGGRFRGALANRGREIRGFWIQPPEELSNQPFASPLVLRRTAPNVWRGTVRPLPDRFTLYLRIFAGPGGTQLAAFRNPETNSTGGFNQYRVTVEGKSVVFLAPTGARLTATFRSAPDRLEMVWPDVRRTLELTRRTEQQARDFFPRPPGEPPYVYRKPADAADGWQTARAADVGMDEEMLARLVRRLIASDPADRRPILIHSLQVARHGKLVLDEYFFGFDRDRPHDIRSAGKTFASVMLGAAMMRGTKVTPETHIDSLLAGMGPFANPDPRKSQITLAHLMTHSSGLCSDEDDSPGSEGAMQQQRGQPNWWKYILDLPLEHDPGSRYAYCSGGMNLVGGALTVATGAWLPELFDRLVARPLHFGPYYWNLQPNDEGYLGGGAFLRPRDLLKVGQAYLNGGTWRNRRIVPSSWVARSTSPHIEISEATTGVDAKTFAENYIKSADGYAWHLFELHSGERTYREFEANGNGGQFLIVVPELDLVVVFTAGNYRQGGIWNRYRFEIVPKEIIPAIRVASAGGHDA